MSAKKRGVSTATTRPESSVSAQQRGAFTATARPRRMVARNDLLDVIKEAITADGDECRIISIQGMGGMGKTRLLEEVLRRFRHEETEKLYGALQDDETWPADKIAFCHAIDFSDIKAHTREYFIGMLGDSSRWHVEPAGEQTRADLFPNFRRERQVWQHLINQGSTHEDVAEAAGKALDAFWDDYHRAADNRRLVMLMDTTEQLAIISSDWLIQHNLITPEDTAFATQRWLLEAIAAGQFHNTTILIAGRDRPEDGELFFQNLSAAAKAGNALLKVLPITPFTRQQTREYFETLLEDWQTADEHQQPVADATRDVYRNIVEQAEALRVLHLYTGGQPVRLALYSDIMVEVGVPPEPLQHTWAEATEHVGLDPAVEEVSEAELTGPQRERLDAARREIERDFIRVLFQFGRGLQPQILRALARAPRGLDAEQLHFILHSNIRDRAREWQPQPANLAEVRQSLEHIQRLAIVRGKPDNRYGLQDEVYRIFAERMSDDEESRLSEMRDRRRLYTRLLDWIEARRNGLMAEWRELVQGEIASIRIKDSTRATSVSVPRPSPGEQDRRQRLSADLLEAELERVHYRLRLQPDVQFNVLYTRLVSGITSNFEDARAATVQAEVWRILKDRYAMRFVQLEEREIIRQRHESPFEVLIRAAAQDDAVQWLVRMVMYKEYSRAIQLADGIEREVLALTDPVERHSWNHTLARADRACWHQLARIYRNQNRSELEDAVKVLEAFADDLEALAAKPQDVMVFPERNENGFKGHPAEDRVKIVLSKLSNNEGYGYVLLGDYRQAVRAYTRSLQALRTVAGEETEILQAVTRNNLSRALAELGKPRAVEVCLDGLRLRQAHGALVSIGYSFNTLALIWNDFRRARQALAAGQRALAIGKYTADRRLRGLALLQVGEALRRIAGQTAEDGPAEAHEAHDIFLEAYSALDEALEIFVKSTPWSEPVRGIETSMELGSLYRDWTRHAGKGTPTNIKAERLEDARHYLVQALNDSRTRGLHHLELDARVNIAQAHFYADQFEEAEEQLSKALESVPVAEQFAAKADPPTQDNCHSYNLKQLSKLHGLRGEMAFTQLRQRMEDFNEANREFSRHERQKRALRDGRIQELLEKAAVAYTLATSYAQLYSPGSELLAILYKELYSQLKELNATEMRQFYAYERRARRLYRTGKLKLENQGDLESFLLDCFGDFYEPAVRISEADVSSDLVLE